MQKLISENTKNIKNFFKFLIKKIKLKNLLILME